ncbi:GNAT family N-acetyltransferase [Dyella sp. SG609]|uniref:GNAT family N-acetyltransferase n=1 Tax=Dyella sp. SG609 TaxID=2587018 RepID=UPI001445206E|nr:GNAT family N-acetyltransferase [Dyella sp. SG609]NKJ20409.1 GNAT superfamily N-acetyltransferase [Dyella sp. SG609]
MTIAIRLATDDDRPALRELFLQARRATFTWAATDSFRLEDYDGQTRGERVLVALDGDGSLAGFVALWESDRFVHHLYLAAGQQRRGIGRALLQALGWPEQPLQMKCLRRNEAALAFYEKLGFAGIGQGQGADGEYVLLASHRARAVSG